MPEDLIAVEPGDTVADKTNSYVKISNFTPNSGDIVMYGICTEAEANELRNGIGTGAQIKAVLYDGCLDSRFPDEKFEYCISGVPSTAIIDESLLDGNSNIKLEDAAPDKVLAIYSVTQETVDGKEKNTITKYDLISLKDNSDDKNALLQYPCSIVVSVESGNGQIVYGSNSPQKVPVIELADYDSTVSIAFIPADGYTLDKIIINNPDDKSSTDEIKDSSSFEDISSNKGITLSNIHHDYRIKAQFVTV